MSVESHRGCTASSALCRRAGPARPAHGPAAGVAGRAGPAKPGPSRRRRRRLELGHIDFLSREIHVRQQLTRMPGEPPYLGELKTRTSRRTVELPEIVQLALARHVERYPSPRR
jgi:hypothetical protein